MPKDDERFKDWIARYNSEKKWTTIVVPGGEKGAIRSPTKELGTLLEQSKADESKLGKELGELNMVVVDLVRKVRDEQRDLEKFRLENDLKIAQKKQKELSARHDIACEVTLKRARLLKQMEELDETIRDDILGLHGEIDKIAAESEKQTPKGDQSRGTYDILRDEVAQEIDKVRDTPVTLRDPSLEETKRYNGISTPEYTLLQTMLLKADALADNDDADGGEEMLEDALDKLKAFAKARRGIVLAQVKPDRNPEVQGPVAVAQQAIAAIRAAGLARAAETLESELDQATKQFENGKKGLGLGLKMEDLRKPHETLAEKCREAADKLGPYKSAVAEMARLIKELRLLGDDNKANDAEGRWLERDQTADIDVETKWIESQIDPLRSEATQIRDDLLRQEQVDPEAVRKKLDSIKQNVETLYKHHRDGSRKTQTDAKSQAPKDIQKDKDIPREALDEISMRIKMGELMLETNSVDAFKRAAAYLDEIEKFETDVKDNASKYPDTKDGIQAIRDIFTKLEKRYRPYLLEKRSNLKITTDAFEKDYKKQAPATNATKLKDLTKQAEDTLIEARELKTFRKKFDKTESEVKKEIASFGKLFADEKYEKNGQSIKGYWGKFSTDLDAAHAEAEKNTKEGLATALVQLGKIHIELQDQRVIVEKRMNLGRGGMKPGEINQWIAIRDDAIQGQNAHDADEAAKTEWKRDHPVLEKRLNTLKKLIGGLKLDQTDIDLAILELDASATKQKTAPDYVEAMKELKRISGLADEMEAMARELATFKTDPIDKAANLVCDQLDKFTSFVDGFAATVRKADDAADQKFDLGKFKTFLDLVKSAVPDQAINSLRSTSAELAKDTSLSSKSRELRERALADVRLISGRLRGSTAIKHFAQQTFATDASLDTALAGLDRCRSSF